MLVVVVCGATRERLRASTPGNSAGNGLVRVDQLTVFGAENVVRVQEVQAPPHVAEQ
jgi:hypothetical protein